MASGVNKVILVGNLGNDPEVRTTPSGANVCELSIATNESWTDKKGEKQERTEWHRVIVWGRVAENCGKYLSKGRQVYLEGRIQTRSWEDKEGNKRYTTEIIASDVQFLSGGGARQSGDFASQGQSQQSNPSNFNAGSAGSNAPAGNDDIPF